MVSVKSTRTGLQPDVSLTLPLIDACTPDATPAKLNAILIAAKLHPETVPSLCVVPFVGDQLLPDGYVGKVVPP